MTYSETRCSICGWEVEAERAVFYFGAVAADTRDRLRTHYLWHMAVAAQPTVGDALDESVDRCREWGQMTL